MHAYSDAGISSLVIFEEFFLLSDFKHPTEMPELIASFLTWQWRTLGTSRGDLAQESLFLDACALQRKSEQVDHQTVHLRPDLDQVNPPFRLESKSQREQIAFRGAWEK